MTVLNLASERCVATDEICVKGVRGCFLDKRFIGSCVMQEPINFARVGTAVPCLPSMFSLGAYSLRRVRHSVKRSIHLYVENYTPNRSKNQGFKRKNTVIFCLTGFSGSKESYSINKTVALHLIRSQRSSQTKFFNY